MELILLLVDFMVVWGNEVTNLRTKYFSMRILTLSTCHILYSRPPVEDHRTVMVNMKERQLIVLLPQDDQDLYTEK